MDFSEADLAARKRLCEMGWITVALEWDSPRGIVVFRFADPGPGVGDEYEGFSSVVEALHFVEGLN